jgi:hypothetical protein
VVNSRIFQNDCRRKINRINSRFSRQVGIADLDETINEAFRTWFRNQAAKFEVNSETRNDLRIFEIKNESIQFSKEKGKVVSTFPKGYYKLINQRVLGSVECGSKHLEECKGCIDRSINVRIVQSGEINDLLNDPYWQPSFEWKETIGDEASDGFHIWHNDKFKVGQVLIDYLREPKEFRCPSLMKEGYYTIGNKKYNKDLPLELDPIRSHEVSDLVALFIARDLSDGEEYQSQIDKILRKDSVYLSP